MTTILVSHAVGSFAENKDVARNIRVTTIIPTLQKGEDVTLDFSGVNFSTQSFMHALLSAAITELGAEILDRMIFKNCNENVQGLINIVVEYSQASIDRLSLWEIENHDAE